jgi:hypothetical protein
VPFFLEVNNVRDKKKKRKEAQEFIRKEAVDKKIKEQKVCYEDLSRVQESRIIDSQIRPFQITILGLTVDRNTGPPQDEHEDEHWRSNTKSFLSMSSLSFYLVVNRP